MPIEAIKKLPKPAQSLFERTMSQAKASGKSDEMAAKIAWGVVKKRFKKTENGTWVARTCDFKETTYFTFQASKAEEFVSRTEDGNLIHNYVLSDVFPDRMGTAPTANLLNKWAAWINNNQPEVDSDHTLFETAKKLYGGNVELVGRMMKSKKGIAKAMKAFVDNGKLVVSLMFDKRYEKHVEKVKGLSVEAAVETNPETKKWDKGNLFGFTFAMNADPVNSRAKRIYE